MSYYIFNLNHNIEYFSFSFYYLYITDEECVVKSELLIQKMPNKNSKYVIKGKNICIDIIESHFDKIEEIHLSFSNKKNQCSLYIEENSSISAITKIRIKYYDYIGFFYIPIKSLSSLNVLQLEMNTINFKKELSLFSKNSSNKYDNLEHLEIHSDNALEPIQNLLENFSNILNLRILSIFSKNMPNTPFSIS